MHSTQRCSFWCNNLASKFSIQVKAIWLIWTKTHMTKLFAAAHNRTRKKRCSDTWKAARIKTWHRKAQMHSCLSLPTQPSAHSYRSMFLMHTLQYKCKHLSKGQRQPILQSAVSCNNHMYWCIHSKIACIWPQHMMHTMNLCCYASHSSRHHSRAPPRAVQSKHLLGLMSSVLHIATEA